MGVRKLTQEEIIQHFIDKHGDKYLYDRVEYVNAITKVWIGCKVDGHDYFEQTPNAHKSGRGCYECGKGSVKTPQEKIIEQFKEKHGDKYEYSKVEYKGSSEDVIIICKIKGHGEFLQTPNGHKQGRGCQKCGGTRFYEANKISLTHPELVQCFVNIEDCENNSIGSNKKVYLKCPICNNHKKNKIKICSLISKPVSCVHCSDKISIPEKYGIYIFKQLNIDFKTQKVFKWSKNKRYDFYFVLNGEEFVCEIHGSQHYINSTRGRSLKEEQENDLLKYNLAIDNGIKPENYIVIDGRNSTNEWLKSNYASQLEKIISLSKINWDEVWIDSQSNMLIKACEMWNNRNLETDTTVKISEDLNVARITIIKWLKIGNEVGLCSYNPDDEYKKAFEKSIITNSKIVYQYSLDGVFISKWKSTRFAERELGIARGSVSHCASGKVMTAGKFKWSYVELHSKEENEETLVI